MIAMDGMGGDGKDVGVGGEQQHRVNTHTRTLEKKGEKWK